MMDYSEISGNRPWRFLAGFRIFFINKENFEKKKYTNKKFGNLCGQGIPIRKADRSDQRCICLKNMQRWWDKLALKRSLYLVIFVVKLHNLANFINQIVAGHKKTSSQTFFYHF